MIRPATQRQAPRVRSPDVRPRISLRLNRATSFESELGSGNEVHAFLGLALFSGRLIACSNCAISSVQGLARTTVTESPRASLDWLAFHRVDGAIGLAAEDWRKIATIWANSLCCRRTVLAAAHVEVAPLGFAGDQRTLRSLGNTKVKSPGVAASLCYNLIARHPPIRRQDERCPYASSPKASSTASRRARWWSVRRAWSRNSWKTRSMPARPASRS